MPGGPAPFVGGDRCRPLPNGLRVCATLLPLMTGWPNSTPPMARYHPRRSTGRPSGRRMGCQARAAAGRVMLLLDSEGGGPTGHTAVGVRAGQIVGAAAVESELAVDAFIVSVADLAGGEIVATTDTGDLERLAAHARSVTIVSIQP